MKLIRRLQIHPTNPEILFAATSDGIYRTLDGGNNWTKVRGGYYKDIEFKPGDPNVIYAASSGGGANIFRSTDGGTTWAQVTSFTGMIFNVNWLNIFLQKS